MKPWNPRLTNRACRLSRSARRRAAIRLGAFTDALCIEPLESRTLLTAQPDLTVTAASDGVTAVQLNDSLTVNWTVTNQGDAAAAGSWNDSLYLSTTSDFSGYVGSVGEFAINNPTPLAVGGSYSEQETGSIPAYVNTGPLYLLVVTNSDSILFGAGSGLDESNYANNTFAIPITVTQPNVDLQVTAASATQTAFSERQYETATVNFTVTNNGTDTAVGPWQDTVYLSKSNAFDFSATFIGSQISATHPLAAGASYQSAINVNLAGSYNGPGTYYLFIYADSSGQQSDVSLTNEISAPITITISTPDLAITAANSGQTTATLGQTVSVAWTVQNLGSAIASAPFPYTNSDGVYLSNTPTFDSSAQFVQSFTESQHFPLANGGSYSDSGNVVIPPTATGARYLLIVANPGNLPVFERNLTNNTFAIPITITASALTITTASAPLAAVAGDSIPISWTVQNEGTGAAVPPWLDEVYISPDNTFDNQAVGLGSYLGPYTQPLPAGASYSQLQNIVLPSTLTGPEYLLIVSGDETYPPRPPHGGAPSVFVLPIDVSAAHLTTDSVTTLATGNLGQAVAVNWTVTNDGTGPANESWSDAIYLSQSSTFDSSAILLSTVPVGSNSPLAAGASYQGSTQVTLPFTAQNAGVPYNLASGTYYVFVVADQNQSQPVTTTVGATAVSASIAVVLPTLPDLIATSVTAPANGFSAQSTPVSWTDKNQGSATAAGSWVDTVYWSTNAQGTNPVYAGTFNIPGPLAVGATTVTISGEVPLPAAPGNYWLVVSTNSDGGVVEGPVNSLNDTTIAAAPIAVAVLPLPDLVVTGITPPLNGVLSGTSVPVSFTVKNQGTAPSSGAQWQDWVVLSQDPTLGSSYLGTLDSTGPTGDRTLDNQPVIMGFANASYLGVGQSYQQTVNLPLPLTAQGTWYVYVIPDGTGAHHRFAMPELNRTDKLAISSGFSVALNPPPDLAVTNVQAAPQLFSGQNTTVNWTVNNSGSGPVVASESVWSDQVYLSTSSVITASSVLLGTFREGSALAAGASYSDSRTVTLPAGISGTYYLLASTNVNNDVFENGNTSDNVSATPPITVNLTPPPDLATTITTAPDAGLASHAITFTYNVTNTGAGSAPNYAWNDAFYLSQTSTFDPSTAILLGRLTQPGPLSAGDSYTRTVTETLLDGVSGTYYLYAEADSDATVYELPSSEADRLSAPVAIQITSNPANLAVTSVQSPNAAVSGGTALVSWTVTNQGSGDTAVSNWQDNVYAEQSSTLDSNGILLAGYVHLGLLNAGSSYTQTEQVPIPISLHGAYNLFVVTNEPTPAQDVPPVYQGTDPVNNTSAAKPISFVQALADLQVTSVSNVSTVAAGQAITANWTVQNTGTGATNSNYWFDDVWLSTNATVASGGTDIYLGTLQHSNPLAAGASYNASLSVVLPPSLPIGSYHLIVATDRPVEPLANSSAGKEVVFESSYANNQTAEPGTTNVTLGATPNLTVSAVTVPATGSANQPLAVSWTVINTGAATGDVAINDSVYLSLDQIFDPHHVRYLGTFSQSNGLAANASYTQSVQVNVPPGAAGTYYVFVQTDGDDSIFENDTTGQVAIAAQSVNISLLPPVDLVAGTVTVPATGLTGQNITLSYQVTNSGTQTANGSWTDALYLSPTPTWTASDPLLGLVQESRILAGGGSYTGTLTAPLPGVAVGSYYVILRSNILDTLAETTLGNNLSASLTQTSIGVPALTLGTPTTGTLANQQSAFYQVTVAAGQTLQFNFASQSANSLNQLFVSFGSVPSRNQADLSAQSFAANQTITVPNTQAGTYYVLAYGSSVPTSPENYSITATVIPFSIAAATPDTVGNSGNATIQIDGARFDRATTFQLLNNANAVVASSSTVSVADSATAYATFNLAGVLPGNYALRAMRADGSTTLLPAGVTVKNGTGSLLQTFVSVPAKVLHGGISSFTVTYKNLGDADMAAPLLTLLSSTSTPFGFTPAALQHNVPVTFFGVSPTGPAGILRPGESVSQTFSFQSSATVGTPYQFDLQVVTASDTRPIDWSAVESRIALSVTTAENYPAIFADLQTRLGSTWGSYVAALAANASLMPSATDLGSNNSEYDLLNLSVLQAEADNDLSVSGTLVATDPSLPVGGLSVFATDSSTYAFTTASGITLNDGSFIILPIDPGTYALRVEGVALQTLPAITVEAGQSITGLTLTETPSFTLSGNAIDAASGQPVSKLAVQAIGADGTTHNATITNNQFTFGGLTAQRYTIVADADGEARTLTTVNIAGVNATLSIAMQPAATISGVVNLGPGGSTGAATYVSATPSGTNSGILLFTSQSNDNSFNLTGLPAGSYDLEISQNGYTSQTIANVSIATGKTIHLSSITLQTGARISGTVESDVLADPPAGSQVGLFLNGVAVDTTFADSNGNYSFEGVAPGSYTLNVVNISDALVTQYPVTAISGQTVTGVQLDILYGATIQGIISLVGGQNSLGYAQVTLTRPDGQTDTKSTDANGVYVFPHLTAGTYTVSLGSDTSQTITIVGAEGEADEVDLTSSAIASISGQLLLSNGQPDAGATVQLAQNGRRSGEATTDVNGVFGFYVSTAGTYDLTADSQDASYAPVTGIEVADGQNVIQDLNSGTSSVIFSVSGPADSVPGTVVKIDLQTANGLIPAGTVVVDSSGQAEFGNLIAGTYTVAAVGNNDFGIDTQQIVAASGQQAATLTLVQQYSYSGTVVDASGNPISGANIVLTPTTGGSAVFLATTVSAADGTFSVTNVTAGNYSVSIFAGGFQGYASTSTAVNAGSTAQSIALPPVTTSVSGTVLTQGNNVPVSGVQVQLLSSTNQILGQAFTDASGNFVIGAPMQPGAQLVATPDPDFFASATLTNIAVPSQQTIYLTPEPFSPSAGQDPPPPPPILLPVDILPPDPPPPFVIIPPMTSPPDPGPVYVKPDTQTTLPKVIIPPEKDPTPIPPLPAPPPIPPDPCPNCQPLINQVNNLQDQLNTVQNKYISLYNDALSEIIPLLRSAVKEGVPFDTKVTVDLYKLTGLNLGGLMGKVADYIEQLSGLLSKLEEDAMNPDVIQGLFNNFKDTKETVNSILDIYEKKEEQNSFNKFKLSTAFDAFKDLQNLIKEGDPYSQTQVLQAKLAQKGNELQSLQQKITDLSKQLKSAQDALNNCDKNYDCDNPQPPNPNGPKGGGGGGVSGGPKDPNTISGPTGFGSANFVSVAQPLPYQIDFENEPLASFPAQQVTVTQQLDSNLNWQSFRLGSFGFGGTTYSVPANAAFYQTQIDLVQQGGYDVDVTGTIDESTGIATWTFTTIDPATGQIPLNPMIGFLPPDSSGGIGEGFVSYTISAKPTDTTGTVINAQASVIFYTQAPVNTPQIFNTIDAGTGLTSTVAPLSASQSSPQITVSWSGSDADTGSAISAYDLYVSVDGGPFVPWLTDTTQDTGVYVGQIGHSYGFISQAFDNAGNIEPLHSKADASTSLQLQGTATTTSVSSDHFGASTYGQTVQFTATIAGVTGTPSGSVQFEIDSVDVGAPVPLSGGTASFSTSGLNATSHTITAFYLSDSASFSNSHGDFDQAVSPALLTVTANSPSKVYGAALPALTFSAGTFVNGDTAATALNGTLSTTATASSSVGGYPISQGTLAAANYIITFVPGTLNVTAAPLTVTANSASKVYGAALPSLTFSAGTFVNGDTAATALIGALATATSASSPVAGYPITQGTLAAANYTITFVPGTLNVTAAPLTVTANSPSKVYGAALPALTFSAGMFVNGDTAVTALTGALATTASASSPVTNYPITQGTLAAANYTITFVPGTLNVTAAPLTVTANSPSKVYGAALPALTYSASTFVNGDTATTALTGALSTTATASSPVASYPITQGTLAAANYTITFVPGLLSVTRAPLTVTAGSPSKVYGAALPALTFSASTFVNGDTAATALTGALATTATASSPVANYPITQGTLAAANYTITFLLGSLSVTPAPLTVTANSPSKVYGAAMPSLTYTAGTFVNSDTAATTLTGGLSTPATAASPVNTYAISQGTLAAANYTITFVPGTLQVTPASLKLTADNKSKTTGSNNPPLTFSSSGFVNGDSASGLTAQPSLTTTAATSSPVGSYPISISGAVDPNYSISYVGGTLTVAAAGVASKTTFASVPNPSVYGQTIVLVAAVSPASGSLSAPRPNGTVTFMDGSTVLGTGSITNVLNREVATFTTSGLAFGSHSITAVFAGGNGYTGSTSTAVTETVKQAATTVSLTTQPKSSIVAQSVTLTATVNVTAPGSGLPAGNIVFKDGSTVLGPGTTAIVGGKLVATYTTSSLAVGSHTITAAYSGDVHFKAGTSAASSLSIGKASTTTALGSSLNPAGSGQTITLTAKIAVASPGGGIPGGTVTFKNGNVTLGTAPLQNMGGSAVATLPVSTLSLGTHTLTAVYAGSVSYNGSTSAALTQTINIGHAVSSVVAPFDINGDGVISPLDVLMIINQLNSKSALTSDLLSAFDVNHDDQLTPLDALTIIDYLNSPTAQQAASTPAVSAVVSAAAAPSATVPGSISTEALAFALSMAPSGQSGLSRSRTVDAMFGSYSDDID